MYVCMCACVYREKQRKITRVPKFKSRYSETCIFKDHLYPPPYRDHLVGSRGGSRILERGALKA